MSGEATLDRPAGAEVLRELRGVVELAPDQALSALAERLDPRGASAFLVDPRTRTIVLQGGFRGLLHSISGPADADQGST